MKKLLLILFLFMSGLTYGQGVQQSFNGTAGLELWLNALLFNQTGSTGNGLYPGYIILPHDDSANVTLFYPSLNTANNQPANAGDGEGMIQVITDSYQADSSVVGTGLSDTHFLNAEYFRKGFYRVEGYAVVRGISSGSTDSVKVQLKYTDPYTSRTDVLFSLNTHTLGNRATGRTFVWMYTPSFTFNITPVGSPTAAAVSWYIVVEKLQ